MNNELLDTEKTDRHLFESIVKAKATLEEKTVELAALSMKETVREMKLLHLSRLSVDELRALNDETLAFVQRLACLGRLAVLIKGMGGDITK